ncbi:MAG: DNA-directed RNA polymerase subunit H [Candidatus Lokiarchaeota archaeon]|nr:DNA-directed RNA polymerase subunit H [Candidatus Lokiarchaeota archaeon]
MLNVLEHQFVPKHEILNYKEAEQVLERLKVDRIQLPNIYNTDPVVKIIGAKEGDVIKITRKSKTAGTSIAYRHVIKEPDAL